MDNTYYYQQGKKVVLVLSTNNEMNHFEPRVHPYRPLQLSSRAYAPPEWPANTHHTWPRQQLHARNYVAIVEGSSNAQWKAHSVALCLLMTMTKCVISFSALQAH